MARHGGVRLDVVMELPVWDNIYGRNGAETISGLCGTRVVLAAPDRDTAQWSADSLGRSEVEEATEGFSYGANTIRDGVSLKPKRELRALALASEIMQLESLYGWLRFPSPLPVARIRLDYVKRSKATERFVPRREAPQCEPEEKGSDPVPDRGGRDGDADGGVVEVAVEIVPDEPERCEAAEEAAADTGGDFPSLPPPDLPARGASTTASGQNRAAEALAGDREPADASGNAEASDGATAAGIQDTASAGEAPAAPGEPEDTSSSPDAGEDGDAGGDAHARPACELL